MSEPPQPDRVDRFFGAALMAVGALIFGLCGLCTVVTAGSALITMAMYRMPAMLGSLALSLVLGGLPTVGGFFVMRFGWRMYRGVPDRAPKAAPEISDD